LFYNGGHIMNIAKVFKRTSIITIVLFLGTQMLGMQYIPFFGKKEEPQLTKGQQAIQAVKNVAGNPGFQVGLGTVVLAGTIGAGVYAYNAYTGNPANSNETEAEKEIKQDVEKIFNNYDPEYTGLAEVLAEIKDGNKKRDYVIAFPGYYMWKPGMYKGFFDRKPESWKNSFNSTKRRLFEMYKDVTARTISFQLPTRDIRRVTFGGGYDGMIALYSILKLIQAGHEGRIILFGHSRGGAALLTLLDMVTTDKYDAIWKDLYLQIIKETEEDRRKEDLSHEISDVKLRVHQRLLESGYHYVSAPLLSIKNLAYRVKPVAKTIDLSAAVSAAEEPERMQRETAIKIIRNLAFLDSSSKEQGLFKFHFYMLPGDVIVGNTFDKEVKKMCEGTKGHWEYHEIDRKKYRRTTHSNPVQVYKLFATYLSELGREE